MSEFVGYIIVNLLVRFFARSASREQMWIVSYILCYLIGGFFVFRIVRWVLSFFIPIWEIDAWVDDFIGKCTLHDNLINHLAILMKEV
jgi:biotin transporter BioY